MSQKLINFVKLTEKSEYVAIKLSSPLRLHLSLFKLKLQILAEQLMKFASNLLYFSLKLLAKMIDEYS